MGVNFGYGFHTLPHSLLPSLLSIMSASSNVLSRLPRSMMSIRFSCGAQLFANDATAASLLLERVFQVHGSLTVARYAGSGAEHSSGAVIDEPNRAVVKNAGSGAEHSPGAVHDEPTRAVEKFAGSGSEHSS